jgi:hypothetical protein
MLLGTVGQVLFVEGLFRPALGEIKEISWLTEP